MAHLCEKDISAIALPYFNSIWSSTVFTYAIIVQSGIEVLDHPVTRYLPELAGHSREDSLTKILWEDVTVGALAAHQGGTGGARKLPDLYPCL
jgi:CubicO group peptidase (beta-lactamase class C family)